MANKIIITGDQLERLKINIQEGNVHSRIVDRIKKELDMNYEPIAGIKRKGGEYIETPMIKIKVDGENITPKALYDYIKYKYKVGEEFMKQVISDWLFGKIDDDNGLSKNVALTESINNHKCPICGKESTTNCKCASFIHHTKESLEKGHGSRCENGHQWSYQTDDGKLITL